MADRPSDESCIRRLNFVDQTGWPPGCGSKRGRLEGGRVLLPPTAEFSVTQELNRTLRSRTLLFEITLPNESDGRLFEVELRVPGPNSNLDYKLVLGDPYDRCWSFSKSDGHQILLSKEETDWVERKAVALILDASQKTVRLRQGAQVLGTPIAIDRVPSIEQGSTIQIVFHNHSQEDIKIHSLGLWDSASAAQQIVPSALATLGTLRLEAAPSEGVMAGSSATSEPRKGQPESEPRGTVAAGPDSQLASWSPPLPSEYVSGTGVVSTKWVPLVVPTHELPAPQVEKTSLYPKSGWNMNGVRAVPIQVDLDTVVFEANSHACLVVRARVSSGGAMVDTVQSSEGKRCGYYQKSIAITIHPGIQNKPDVVQRIDKGIHPANVVGEPLTVKTIVEKASGSTWAFKFEPTSNLAVGTIVGAGVNAAFAKSSKQGEEISGIKREWLQLTYKADRAKLSWTGRLGAFKDGTLYESGKEQKDGKLLDVPEFAKGIQVIEVQGMWQFPLECKERKDPLTLQIGVEQVLCYSKRAGRKGVLIAEDKFEPDKFMVVVPYEEQG